MLYCKHKKGQAVVEMAIFGSLVLLVFATLISYLQRFNDQQYVQMEAFRRALEKGNDYKPPTGGRGASVQLSLIQNRRHSDISGGFRKGSAQTLSASSNVFWATPEVGESTESLIAYRVNEDEKVANYTDYIPKEHDGREEEGEPEEEEWSFRIEDLSFNSTLSFDETTTKTETAQEITNSATSQLQDTITTVIPYTIREKEKTDDYNLDNDPIVEEGTFWEPEQGVYIDTDGQYKYSQGATGTVVERGKVWTTPF